MAATTRVDLTNVRILDLDASKRAVDAVSDPKAKFQILDELTDKELTPSVVFAVLLKTGDDPTQAEHAGKNYFLRTKMTATYVNRILETVEKSTQLSQHVMSSIGTSGRNQLSSVCWNVNTYIHTKLFHALRKIVNAPNYHPYIANSNHPLNAIHTKMWELQEDNHGNTCPCFEHIEAHLAEKVQPSDPESATTRITVKYDAGMGNRLYIRGEGGRLGHWDKGFELKNIGGDTWVFETQDDFPELEYKIKFNDNQWENCENRKIGRGKKEEIRPTFQWQR
jgi:hypothetical protein